MGDTHRGPARVALPVPLLIGEGRSAVRRANGIGLRASAIKITDLEGALIGVLGVN
jgi:hypothetical protein